MKIPGLIFLLQITWCITFSQPAAIPIFYHEVNMPSFLKGNYYGRFDTRILAEDLATLLEQSTGRKFSPTVLRGKQGDQGIFLLLDESFSIGGSETGRVMSDGKKRISISARYTTGISYAMYSWLKELGFRFYLPGEKWNKVPVITDIFKQKKLSNTYSPAFRLRMMYVSGGTYAVKGLDDEKLMEKDWQQWYQRNRMGCDYIKIDGHIGELFNLNHKEEIEKDPAILAPINGKRQYATGGKIDPTNKKAVDMFTSWITASYKKDISDWPSFLPFRKYQTADAGDGGNYCHTPECRKAYNSVSDQAFSIINEAAKKIRKVDTRAGVSTLAYTERADTPGIRIEPNVHVMVVPTAFQAVSTATNLMQRWAKKSSNISMYDYLNIGVWAWDKPFFNMYDYHQNLRFLQRLRIEGIHYETSFSSMASGLQQYIILRFLAEPFTSVDNVLNEFCDANFEEASEPIKLLFKEWYFSSRHLKTNYDHPSFYEDELGRFIKYIIQAENKQSNSPAVQQRINEVKAYTIYLCMYYELFAELSSLESFAKNPELKKKKAAEILAFTWQHYESRIFHNTQLNDLYKQMLDEKEKPEWDYQKSQSFSRMRQSDAAMINQQFDKYKTIYLPMAQEEYTISDNIMHELVRYSADSFRITSMDEEAFKDFSYPIQFYASAPGKLKIRYTAGKSGLNTDGKVSIISVEARDYTYTKTDIILLENSAGVVQYQIPKKGHYRLYLSQYRATPVEFIIYPGKNLFYHAKKSIMMNGLRMQEPHDKAGYPNRYLAIYVPLTDSARYVQYSSLYYSSTNSSRFYLSNGEKLHVKDAGKPNFYRTDYIPYPPTLPVVFYDNTVYRWPPVVKSAPACYFYLKYPIK